MNGNVKSDLGTLEFKKIENLKILIAELSDFNGKLTSMDKMYLLKGFFSGTKRNYEIDINSRHSL